MVDRDRLLADRTDLRAADRAHLRTLVADWTLLADLTFADLVLWVPTWNRTGFTAVAQVRPTTGPTALPDDVVGHFAPKGRRHLIDRAFASGHVSPDPKDSAKKGNAHDTGQAAIPVIRRGEVIAVIARHSAQRVSIGGSLEAAYLQTADDLLAMVVSGDFPLSEGVATTHTPPRVGDGLVRLDNEGTVVFASPNASSAFHRLGLAAELVGSDLAATASRLGKRPGPIDEAVALVATGRAPGEGIVENDEATVTLRSLPLRRDGRRSGALVLVRDVTDLRVQERALLTKDATIREIHHRVKNNLQTVAALLRLQARRIDEPQGRAALEEAVRRVGAIAVVHETLARDAGGDVDFDEVASRIVGLTRDLADGVKLRQLGTAGSMPAEMIAPLAMALAELLQNAVQHGLDGEPGEVTLRLRRADRRLTLEVTDTGRGLPEGFNPTDSPGLGLQIVRTLINDELSGAVSWEPGVPSGTSAVVDVLVPAIDKAPS